MTLDQVNNMDAGKWLINKLNTSDILRLMEKLGVPETEVRYGNNALIFPTVCHNELIGQGSHKLYYYEDSKRFYCYTHCHAMSVYEFIINVYAARNMKITYSGAYTLLDSIVADRLKHGFAIIQEPTEVSSGQFKENWEDELTVYNEHVLECFTQQPKYLAPWIEEGIDYDVLIKYGVRFDMVRNRIMFPVIDHLGRLVGIKVRNFNKEDLDEHRKYMPLWLNKELYSYPKMMVLYGFYQNKSTIKRAKECIVFEAEKSVMLFDSYFTNNKSVSMGGSSFSQYHAQILKNIGVQKIILAMDNDWSDDGNKMYGLEKAIKEGRKIQEMGFDVDIIYDWNQEYLGDKDAPVDKGRQVYSKLYRDRKNISEFGAQDNVKEETVNEIPVEVQEL